jgi:3'(2'), 5'-bisphosphate nucleotidase
MIDLAKPEVSFALQSVQKASKLVQNIQKQLVSPALSKEDRSPVTIADFASQALIGKLLLERFPNDLLVAEEDSTALREPSNPKTIQQVTSFIREFIPEATSELVCQWIDFGNSDSGNRFWTLDPIDGTKGFLRGDQYVVALALLENHEVQIGVLGCPNLGKEQGIPIDDEHSLVIAIRGSGTWVTSLENPVEFIQISVSTQSEPKHAHLLRSYESGHTNISQIDTFSEHLNIEAEPVRLDSQAKYVLLAAGKGDFLLRLLSPSRPDYREKIWDQAAGSIVLEEAGGQITDLDGKPLDFSSGRQLIQNRGILASNKILHKAALSALKSIGA